MAYLRLATALSIISGMPITLSAAETPAVESALPLSSVPLSSGFQSINEDDEEIIKPSVMYDNVVLQALDKVTGRVKAINAKIGTKIAFGTLFITVKQCLKTLPEDAPEAAAYLIIEENNPSTHVTGENIIFRAWMLAFNPSKSALEHPVYDIWIKDCKHESSGNNLNDKADDHLTTDKIKSPTSSKPGKNTSSKISDAIDVEDIQDNPPFMSAEPEQE